jgi:DMSO/TMAO reductase YedYZ molybdopterin-dependent catalytic subunit
MVKAKDHSGASATFEGVSLAEALREAKVTLGKELKGALLANYILVEAADGYRVSFSLPEVDPAMTDNVILIADRKNAKPLDAREGPYRLVVPHDKKFARWVRQATRISVQSPPKAAPRTEGE